MAEGPNIPSKGMLITVNHSATISPGQPFPHPPVETDDVVANSYGPPPQQGGYYQQGPPMQYQQGPPQQVVVKQKKDHGCLYGW